MKRFSVLVCLSALFSTALAAQPVINTYAGGPPPSGFALQIPLASPNAISTDNAGNTYIALAEFSTIYKLDSVGNLTRITGKWDAWFQWRQ